MHATEPGSIEVEPPRVRRHRRPRSPATLAIIVLNVLVFVAWQAATDSPGLAQLMMTNFLVSTSHVAGGFPWTLITAAFSHSELWHLAINMFVLWSFGSVLERLWGTRVFVIFYLVAAVVASICHCLVSTVVMHNSEISALGASGAVSGLLMAYALSFPHHRILLFGIIPVPALAGVLAFVGIDLWGLIAQSRGGGLPIGHGAHLGGALAGALMFAIFLKSMPRPVIQRRDAPASKSVPALTIEEAVEFERIRHKIESEGPHGLTPKERDFLDRLRERVLRAQGGPPSEP